MLGKNQIFETHFREREKIVFFTPARLKKIHHESQYEKIGGKQA